MGRKVFISILGTTPYIECIYKAADKNCNLTRFIQKATLEYLNRDSSWTKDDVAYIFVTEGDKGSRELNWKTPATKERKTPKGDILSPYYGLEEELTKMKNPFPFEGIDIKDGKTDAEMWEVFNTIFSKIEDEDELYLDLTHSFRYLPMLLLVLCNYAKFLKHAHIAGVFYGNYEARKAINGIYNAPLMNLMPLVQLQDWSTAAANFAQFGDTKQLTDLCKEKEGQYAAKQEKSKAKEIKKFSKSLSVFSEDMLFCRGLFLRDEQHADNLLSSIESAKNLEESSALNPILGKIKEEILPLCPDKDDAHMVNLFNIATQKFNDRQYQTSITILEETLISWICRYANDKGIDIDESDYNERHYVTTAISQFAKQQRGETTSEDKVQELLKLDLFADENNKDFIKQMYRLIKIRNDYNHSKLNKRTREIIEKLRISIKMIQNTILRKIEPAVKIVELNDDQDV